MKKKQRNLSNQKIFGHLNRVEELMKNKTCFPVCLEIHPTNRCTHNCFNCTSQDVRSKNNTRTIEGNRLKNIIKQFADYGGKAILWSGGGDPTLYHCSESNLYFKDILQYAHSLGIDQGVYTNGEYLTPELTPDIIKTCTFLRFSLDSFTEKTHQRVHKADAYPKIFHNLERCIATKKQTGSSIDIGVSFVVYPENITDIRHTKTWLSKLQPDYLYFKPGELRKPNVWLITKQKLAFYYVRLVANGYNGATDIEIASTKFGNILHDVKRETRNSCYIGALFPTISADGLIYYCCHTVSKPEFVVGDTNKHSFEEIMKDFDFTAYSDFCECPRNCRGHIINRDVDSASELLNNKHINFL